MRIERGPQRLVRPRRGGRSNSREWVALSSADFMVPSMYVDLLLAYKAAPPPTTSAAALEEGLQKALCDYPEFAGRIQPAHPQAPGGRPVILLNDAGAAFVEAHVQGPLHELLPFDPSPLLSNLVPPYVAAAELLLVQVTKFSCGGMTMGVAWHHHVADAKAAIDFLKVWTHRVQSLPIPFSSTQDRSLLMAKEIPCPLYDHYEFKNSPPKKKIPQLSVSDKQEIVVRKLHFSAELLRTLKERASLEKEKLTRFESLMGHLWRCITRSRGLDKENGGEKEEDEVHTELVIAVNARKRMNLKIEEGYFGNVFVLAYASCDAKRLTREPLRHASKIINASISKIDENFVRSALDYVELKERKPFEVELFNGIPQSFRLYVSSWVNFPLYQLDFGFGSPLFAGNVYNPFEGGLIILPSPQDDGGYDVVICLHTLAMENLLLTYKHVP